MDIKDYEDLSKVTMADLHVAIYNSKEEMNLCLKNKDVKGFLEAFKMNLKLHKLFDKKASLVRKGNENIGKQR